ncbi:hypothetical protein GCM10010286_64180 [Streptomyces toxytricini]|nr:hypothetical protein GCM10010286_64180 [Streptomyces toxytricini]
MAAAEQQLPHGLVLDGELLVWDIEAGRLSFEALHRLAAARARGAPALAARWPAYFAAFDVLQRHGVGLLQRPYAERRALLENLFADHALTAPWASLVPMTTDLATAREWLDSWTDVSGVEGIVAKGLTTRYLPGYRGWTKIRRRDTTEAIIGAITGTLTRPQLLILGRYDDGGRLRAVARTAPLRPDQSRQVAEHLAPAGSGHPFEGVRFPAAWGSRDALDVVLVRPNLTAAAVLALFPSLPATTVHAAAEERSAAQVLPIGVAVTVLPVAVEDRTGYQRTSLPGIRGRPERPCSPLMPSRRRARRGRGLVAAGQCSRTGPGAVLGAVGQACSGEVRPGRSLGQRPG